MKYPALLLPCIISGLFLPLIIFVHAQPSYESCSPQVCGNSTRPVPFGVTAQSASYESCSPQVCGNSTIQYPFGDCGPLSARCDNNQTVRLTVTGYRFWNVVGDITNQPGTLQITPFDYTDFSDNFTGTYNWLIMGGFFNLSHGYQMGTIFNCEQQLEEQAFQRVDCMKSRDLYCYFYPGTDMIIGYCDQYVMIVPVNERYNFELAIQRGFQISWSTPQPCHSCQATGGRCVSSFYYNDFLDGDKNYGDYCACHDGTYHFTNCSDGWEIDWRIIDANQMGNRERNPPPKKASPKPMAGNPPPKKTSTKYMAGKSLI